MTNVLVLNPLNKAKLKEDDFNFKNNEKKINFNYKLVFDDSLSNYIAEIPDLIITEYIEDKKLNNFYFELQILAKSYLIPIIFIIEYRQINSFPVSFIDGSSDFVYFPIKDLELFDRIKLAVLKNEQLKNQIQIDTITNLPNHRSFYNRYHVETSKCLRYHKNISVALLHLKNLKDITEQFDWVESDNIIKSIGEIISNIIREVDYVARFSYDKFAIIFTECEEYDCLSALQRIFERIKKYSCSLEKENLEIIYNTVLGTYPQVTTDEIELIRVLTTQCSEISCDDYKIISLTTHHLKKRTVMLIEDDREVCTYIKDFLKNEKYDVIVKNRFSEDLCKIIVEENVSLLLLDIMLPDSEKDGYEIIEDIRNNFLVEKVPILVITAKGGPLKILEAGADDYLLKPFDSKILLKKMNKLIENAVLTPKRRVEDDLKYIYKTNEVKQIDYLTNLPTLPAIMQNLKNLYKEAKNFGIIYINVAKYNEIELNYGEKIFDNLLIKTSELLKEMKGSIIRDNDVVTISRMWDDDFIIVLSPPRRNPVITLADVSNIKERIEAFLKGRKTEIITKGLEYQFDFYLGYSIIELNSQIKFERMVYNNLKNAMMKAYNKESKVSVALQKEFKDIIQNEKISMVYQPIIKLEDESIYGFEALTRGPEKSLLRQPSILFSTAYQINMVWNIERLVRKKTFNEYCKLGLNEYQLSINIEPKTVSDPEFRKFIEMNPYNLDLSKIILEITERTNILDLENFKKQLQLFKDCNCKIAIDDAGSGYASLLFIAELKPDILKLDISLIKNIDENGPRSDIVKALVKFAKRHNIIVIAEGIENKKEFEAIKKIGVELGQGFYFSKLLTDLKSYKK